MRTAKLLRPLALLSVSAIAASWITTAEAAPPTWSSLPQGAVQAPPTAAPAAIGPGERVPGVWVVVPRNTGRNRFAMLATSAEAATKLRTEGDFSASSDATCFATKERSFDEEGEEPAWERSLNGTARMWPKTADNPRGGVTAVHSERLVRGETGASLEIADFYVDPATLGARLIRTSSLPLARVASAHGGVEVFAARSEAGGRKVVHWIVARPKPPEGVPINGSLVAFRAGSVEQSNECGHLRVTTGADLGASESATVQVHALLPSRNQKPAAPKAEATPEGDKRAKGVGRFFRRGKFPGGPIDDGNEGRARELEVHLSASSTTRDKEPLLGVSFGWSGREKPIRLPSSE